MSEQFLTALRAIADTVLIEQPLEMQPHLVDWRKRHEGTALAVALLLKLFHTTGQATLSPEGPKNARHERTDS